MLLYYITDRSQFPGDEYSRRSRLLTTVTQAARCSVDYIQLREKDLSTHDLEILAREVVQLGTENTQLNTGVLVNTRTDVALACGAKGVHLRSDDISPTEARTIWSQSGAVYPRDDWRLVSHPARGRPRGTGRRRFRGLRASL